MALVATLAASGAQAQAATPRASDRAAAQAQLEAARADLARDARRVAELSRQLGEEAGVRRVHKPMLGVLLATDPRAGVRIAGVTPDSPAARAGLRSGDRVTAIDGHAILGSSGDLRVANARGLLDRLRAGTPVTLSLQRGTEALSVRATPSLRDVVPAYAFVDGNGSVVRAFGDVLLDGDARHPGVSARAFEIAPPAPPGVPARIQREVVRLGPGDLCKGEGCGDLPLLAEAFRWNGLNLATVDAQLGRYFGTDSGVLVLSTGQALAGLQAGDVLRQVDGKPVRTPREAMAALQAHPAGSEVTVDYLRDRHGARARITVPKATPWRFPAPPPPPAPPAPPAAPRAPAAPPAPPAPRASDGTRRPGVAALLARSAPPPPPAPPSPPDGNDR